MNNDVIEINNKQYKLSFGWNALSKFEKLPGKSFFSFLSDRDEEGDFDWSTELIILFFVTLQKHHGKEITTLEQAGDLMDEVSLKDLMTVLMALITDKIQKLYQVQETEQEEGKQKEATTGL